MQKKYKHMGLKLSVEEKLEIMNQAYDNAKSEGMDVTASDEEQLAEMTAAFKYKIRPENFRSGTLPDYMRYRRIPEMNECPFCHKWYPHKRKFLLPHIKKCHPAEWPDYWHQNRPRSERTEEMEQYKEHFRYDDTGTSYICNFCEKNFELGRPSKFMNHLRRTHLGFKDFVCDHPGCGAEFTSSWNLKGHKLKVHEKILSHVCKVCDKAFVRKDKLMEHMKSMHIEEWHLERERMKVAREEKKAETKRKKQADDDMKAEVRAKKRAERFSELPDCVQNEAVNSFMNASLHK